MKMVVGALAAAALAGLPMAAAAQTYDGAGWRDGHAVGAHSHVRDANARVYTARPSYQRRAYGGQQFVARRFDDRRRRDRDFERRFRGRDFGVYDVEPYVYSYPDVYGYYAPFDYGEGYDEAPAYDDGYAQAAPAYGYAEGYDEGAPAYEQEASPPGVNWSYGAPPADCGRWVWRPGVGQYEWLPAPCPCPQYGWDDR